MEVGVKLGCCLRGKSKPGSAWGGAQIALVVRRQTTSTRTFGNNDGTLAGHKENRVYEVCNDKSLGVDLRVKEENGSSNLS